MPLFPFFSSQLVSGIYFQHSFWLTALAVQYICIELPQIFILMKREFLLVVHRRVDTAVAWIWSQSDWFNNRSCCSLSCHLDVVFSKYNLRRRCSNRRSYNLIHPLCSLPTNKWNTLHCSSVKDEFITKKKISVIMYSSWCYSKPVWLYFLPHKTKKWKNYIGRLIKRGQRI